MNPYQGAPGTESVDKVCWFFSDFLQAVYEFLQVICSLFAKQGFRQMAEHGCNFYGQKPPISRGPAAVHLQPASTPLSWRHLKTP